MQQYEQMIVLHAVVRVDDWIDDDSLELLLVPVGGQTYGVDVGWLSGKGIGHQFLLSLPVYELKVILLELESLSGESTGRVYDVLKPPEDLVVDDDDEVAPLQIPTKFSDSRYSG